MKSQPREPITKQQYWKTVFIGLMSGAVLVVIPYILANVMVALAGYGFFSNEFYFGDYQLYREHIVYSYSLLLFLPLVQGGAAGTVAGPYSVGAKYIGITFLILILDLGLAYVLFNEGYICLIITVPLYLPLFAIGIAVGRKIVRRDKAKMLRASLIPLVLLAVVVDAGQPAPEFSNAISDAVTINASPEYVWRYIVKYPENTNPPEYWLWKVGLPAPTYSTAEKAAVGASRECRFTKGITFGEQITELKQNKVLTFRITKMPDHPEILGHFNLEKGQLYLERNPDGSTTVIATSWYKLFVRPSSYFNWWAEDIVRNVHFRVLNHIKELAENDKNARVAAAY